MSQFLDEFEEKMIETAMKLPYSEDTERIVTIECTPHYKIKFENELLNDQLSNDRPTYLANLPINTDFKIVGINLRFKTSKWYIKPKFKAGYYDRQDNA